MNIDGARIYCEGAVIDHESESKIRDFVSVIKTLSPSVNIGLRILKSGDSYEGLLWGKSNELPIGVYRKGSSVLNVVASLCRKANRECLRYVKHSRRMEAKNRYFNEEPLPLLVAG